MTSALAVLFPPVIYAVVGANVVGLLRWRTARLFDVLLAGYLAMQVPFLGMAWASDRGWLALGCVAVLATIMLTAVLAWRQARDVLVGIICSIDWLDIALFVGVALFVGWPFLGPSPAAPWGVANSDLVDAFAGGDVVFNHPELACLYKEIAHGATNYGQYTASALSFALSGGPPQLLADYWHLQFLFALLALGIATLARDGLGIGRGWACMTGLLVGTSSLMATTIYNGHVGSTMFLPLAVGVIRMGWASNGADRTIRLAIAGAACAMVFMSYLYPAVLFLAAAVVSLSPWIVSRTWMPASIRRLGVPGLLVAFLVLGLLALVAIHPLFASYRQAAEERYRAWAMSLRPEMVGIAVGIDPSGLAWGDRIIRPLLPFQFGLAILAAMVGLAVVGLAYCRERSLAVFLAGVVVAAVAMGAAVAVVVCDSYYFYKVIYIAFPFIVLAVGTGLWALLRIRSGWTGPLLAVMLVAVLLIPNVITTGINARMMTRAPFNNEAAAVEEAVPRIRAVQIHGRGVEAAVTGREYTSLLECYNQRFALRLDINRWDYSEHFKEAAEVALTDEERKRKTERGRLLITTIKHVADEELQIIPRGYPEVLSFEAIQAPIVWSNSIWAIEDRAAVPRIAAFSYFSGVSRFPFALNDQPFRWIRDRLDFKVDRWPLTYRHLSFYAQAGYGSTSGLFDLRVLCNGHELLRRIVPAAGDWIEVDIPAEVLDSTSRLAFVGASVPGPRLLRREFIDMRALVAAIHVAPVGTPRWGAGTLALFNGPDDVTQMRLAGGPMLGPGWGPREIFQGRPLRWLTERPATIVVAGGRPEQALLRLAGGRGPAGAPGVVLQVRSSVGWTRSVAVRDEEIVIPLGAPPADACETLTLTVRDGNSLPCAPDGRRLVFRLDHLEISP